MKRILLVCLVVAGCKSKGSTQVELGTAVHPFGLVANVWLGMTPEELAQKAPELKASPGHAEVFSANPDHASYEVRLVDGHVEQIHVQLMDRSAQDLWKAWGAGTAYESAPLESRRYFDEARGARANVSVVGDRGFVVDIVPMAPLAKLLDGPDQTSIAGVTLLGRPINDVVADLKAHHLAAKLNPAVEGRSEGEAGPMPATEWTAPITLRFTAGADGVVDGWSLSGSVDTSGGPRATPVAKAAILGVYEHRWGKPVDPSAPDLAYATKPEVHVSGEFLMPSVRPGSPPPSPPPAAPPPAPAK